MIPVGEWTMGWEGEKQIPVTRIADNHEITLLMGVTLSGHMLCPQIIYAGKTEKMHPKADSPEGWDI